MDVAVFEAAEWERQACLRLEPRHRVRCTAAPLTPQNAPDYREAEVVTPFVGSEVSAAVIAAMPRLRLVATRSTGFDHIDLAACRARGVAVCNVPDYGDPTVAEHAFALLLAVSRHIVEAAERTRRGDFHVEGLRGFDLDGRTLGVVGAGRIGRRVIRIARGFGMTALAADPNPDRVAAAELGFDYVPLDDLLRRSDVVSLHAPGGPQNRDLISEPQFAVMKPGCVLINTARGGVVNAAALVRALSSGRLAGAGLDVLSEEPLLREEAEFSARTRRCRPSACAPWWPPTRYSACPMSWSRPTSPMTRSRPWNGSSARPSTTSKPSPAASLRTWCSRSGRRGMSGRPVHDAPQAGHRPGRRVPGSAVRPSRRPDPAGRAHGASFDDDGRRADDLRVR